MTVILILFLILLLCSSAFMSASETALFSLSPLTLKSYKNARDLRLQELSRMMSNPREVLVTILMLNILANILVQNTVSSIFGEFTSWFLKVGVPLFLTLVFGELLPKSMAMPNNADIAYRVFPTIDRLARFLRTVRKPMTKATGWISRFLFFFFQKEKEISADELHHVLKTSEEAGVLLPEECDLIGGCLDLQHSSVKELTRPREEIHFYSVHEPLEKLYSLFVDLEISRIPVCDENLDHLLGVLSARRFFFNKNQIQTPSDLIPFLKKPYYVP